MLAAPESKTTWPRVGIRALERVGSASRTQAMIAAIWRRRIGRSALTISQTTSCLTLW